MKLILALLGALIVQVNCDNIDRIYQGWHLSPHEFPWMVKLKVRYISVKTYTKATKKDRSNKYMVISLVTVIVWWY